MIPFVDLKHIHQPLLQAFQKVQDSCISQSDFVTGKMVSKFEEEFAAYCQTEYCIGVSSGTAALFLALKAIGIGQGDEVIVPSHTFVATAMAVSQCGATPIFTDVDADTWNISWQQIQPKISSNTKAIIAVHIYGNPVNMDDICTKAHQLNIVVIEDAAQAHGALYKNRKIGSLADMACFSFYPSKNLGALGEGGAVTTQNQQWAEKIYQLRDYGRSDKYKHEFVGYNLRLQGIQAGFLSVKLPYLDQWNEERRSTMHIYKNLLKDTTYQFQSIESECHSVYHLGVIQCENRQKTIERFTANEIGYGIHYPIPCHLQPAYLQNNSSSIPISENLANTAISLPLYVGMKENDIKKVCSVLQEI
ncbi:MAG: DegT/DnrJ/EryC1/StrS family aminotransferase [Chitinophagales bacterium]|nr:DegT/DnrJ/EryC1/StrS family aminotransferase [Chitinophagales bacterium]